MDTGRDIVIEISEDRAAELLLAMARSSREGSCQRLNGARVSVWPTAARFEQRAEGPVALLDAKTSVGELQDYAVPLAEQLRPIRQRIFAALAPLATQIGSEVMDVEFKIVGQGTVVGGIDMWGGIFRDASANENWSAFHSDFRARRDWALFVDKRLLVPVIERAVLRARQDLPFVFEGVEVMWGDPITVTIKGHELTGLGAFGWWHELDVTVNISIDFAVNSRNELILRRRGARVTLEGTFAQIAGWVAGDEIREGIREYTDPERFFAPVSLVFSLPQNSRMVGTTLRLRDDGLIIRGDLDVPEPRPPRLRISPARLDFYEAFATACGAGVPSFEPKAVYLRNDGGGTLFLCGVELTTPGFVIANTNDPGLTIASDGRSLQYTGAGLGYSDSLALTITYMGSRELDAEGVLRVTSNDPLAMVQALPVAVAQEGALEWSVEPEELLQVRVANAQPGEQARQVYENCREQLVTIDPLRAHAGEVRVLNTGRVPVFLCGLNLRSEGRLSLEEPISRRVEPGSSLILRIGFHPTEVGETAEGSLQIRDQRGIQRTVPIEARVDPQAQRGQLSHGSVSGANIGVVFDLAREALCLPSDANICRSRSLFEPVAPEELAVGMFELGPLPAEAEVRFTDDAGSVVLVDTSDRRRRAFAMAWLDGDGFKGNPCIALFDRVSAAQHAALRIRVSGQRVVRVGSLPGDGIVALAPAAGIVVVADADGLHFIEWTDPHKPAEISRLPLRGITALASDGKSLAVATADETVLVDAGNPVQPRITAHGEVSGAGALALISGRVYMSVAKQALVLEPVNGRLRNCGNFPLPISVQHVGLTRWGVLAADDQEVVQLDQNGEVVATWRTDDRIERVITTGRTASVTTRCAITVLRVAANSLQPITWYARAHWSTALVPCADSQRFLRLVEGGRVELWQARQHRLRREEFKGAFQIRAMVPGGLTKSG